MEFLPAAVHPPRQGPAVERDHGIVVGTAGRMERRLHRRLFPDWRFGNVGGLGPTPDGGGPSPRRGPATQISSTEHCFPPFFSPPPPLRAYPLACLCLPF